MKKLLAVFTAVFMVCIMTVPAFAYQFNGTYLGDFTDDMVADFRGDYKYAILNNNNGTYSIILTTVPVKVSGDHVVATSSGHARTYVWNNPNGWYYASQMDLTSGYQVTRAERLAWSTYDIYTDGDRLAMEGDENFLRVPLAELIQGVAEEQLMEETLPKMIRAVTVLVTAGLICLASLAGLVVLKIVFRTFGAR